MKLLLAFGSIISAQSSTEHGESVVAVIHDDRLPQVRVEYENRVCGNTHLKIKMLVDDKLPGNVEGRGLDISLYSTESLEAFFALVDLVREVVKAPTPDATAPEFSILS